ncbi:MAG TPA: penicillin-binding transpeptidase domain-containing protein [Pseudonocardiaceae bacterium]
MSSAGKRGLLIGGVVVMVAIVVVAVVTLTGSKANTATAPAAETTAATPTGPSTPTPTSAAQQYLQAFAAGDINDASELTDDLNMSTAALQDAWNTLKPSEIQTKLSSITPAAGKAATATYTATWTLGTGHVWSYSGTFGVVQTGDNWRVHWTPAVLQPKLQAGQSLALDNTVPDRPAVVDRDGTPLVTAGPSGTKLADTQFAVLRSALVSQVPAAATAFAVERVDNTGRNLETLFGSTGGQAKPVRSTLSAEDQSAAQAAVDSHSGPAVIVALQPSTGGLLAVAQNDQVTESPFSGLYAPGSTFKIVTATATLENGIATPNSELPCPLTEQIGTRKISNEGFDLGTTTMHRAFARSCNTTFGKLASQLPSTGLVTAADRYGLNADFDIPGLATQTGKVVPPADPDQQVEDGIGQGNVQVSPFGEVLMAATVAEGHSVTPRLWQDIDTHVLTGYDAPSASVLAELRPMMREVVTEGTGTGLAHSGTVYGKTGTAQFGNGDEANGWFVGYRGDFAFVVFLAGANDSHPAVTLGATFLAGLK